MTNAKQLLFDFLNKAKSLSTEIEPNKILRSNTYRVGKASILVRTASDLGKRYFFGLNYIHAEEINNIDNSYVAFICGRIDNIIFIPSEVLIKLLPQISRDRNGEYKINFKRDFGLVLAGRDNYFDCGKYRNKWDIISQAANTTSKIIEPEDSLHSLLQGRLLEIGNIRGFNTFCPNKSKTFNRKKLAEISTLESCPKLQYSEFRFLRNIDVLWFRKTKTDYYPEYAFEVELSTGLWSGFGRLASLREYQTKLYIISHEKKKFDEILDNYDMLNERFKLVYPEHVGLLYAAENNLIRLRQEFNL